MTGYGPNLRFFLNTNSGSQFKIGQPELGLRRTLEGVGQLLVQPAGGDRLAGFESRCRHFAAVLTGPRTRSGH